MFKIEIAVYNGTVDVDKHPALLYSTEAAALLGVSKSTLLAWLRAGLVPEPGRNRSGSRVFTGADVARLRMDVPRYSAAHLAERLAVSRWTVERWLREDPYHAPTGMPPAGGGFRKRRSIASNTVR